MSCIVFIYVRLTLREITLRVFCIARRDGTVIYGRLYVCVRENVMLLYYSF